MRLDAAEASVTAGPRSRLALPNIVPLEVWDLPVAGKLLQEWRRDPSFAEKLAVVVRSLRDSYPLAHVHLVGGGVDDAIVAAMPLPATDDRDPFAAARAGARYRPGALCADVGQTAIKLVHGERAWRIERDFTRAPFRDYVSFANREQARASTIALLAEVVPPHPSIVLGLPCELDPAGIPRSCTYCFRDPDPELLVELATRLGASIEVVNDAELAALAARADPRVPRDTTTLVLTIGFGVGGALLLPG